jgi:hypothetical protein
MIPPQMGVDRGGGQVAVAENPLNGQQVDTGFHQFGRESVSQCIHTLPTNSGWRGLFIVFIRFSIDQ